MGIVANRLAGIATIALDGGNLLLSGDLSYQVSHVERESLVGQDRPHGFSEKPLVGFIAGTLRDSGQTDLSALNQATNVTITLELANGKLVVGRNMWQVGPLEVKTQEGTFDVRFEGFSVEEVPAS